MEMDGWRMTETRTVDASEAEEANTGIHFALGFLFSFNFNHREGNNNPTTTDWKKSQVTLSPAALPNERQSMAGA